MSSIKRGNNVSVIIVTYNSEKRISRCLNSVIKASPKIPEIIVIDNNSDDKTLKILKSFRGIKVKSNKINVGFARAVNQAIRISRKSNHILLLNPDTYIQSDSIANLYRCLEKNHAHIAGGKTLKSKKQIYRSFVKTPTFWTVLFDYCNLRKICPGDYFHRVHYYLNEPFPRKDKLVDIVSGSFMLIKKEVFNEIGFFDEKFFMYLEDVDFCIRAMHANLKTIFCPHLAIFHEGGASSNNADKIHYLAWSKSRKYYVKKYFNHPALSFLYMILIFDDAIINIWRKIKEFLKKTNPACYNQNNVPS